MMTQTTPTTTQPTPRPLPLWASIPLILVCLSVGGWIIHWYVGSRVRADEPHLLGDVPTPPQRQANAGPGGGGWRGGGPGGGRGGPGQWPGVGGGNNHPRVAIRRQDGNGTTFEAGTARALALCLFSSKSGKGPTLVTLRYQGGPGYPFRTLPDDVQKTLDNGRRLARDDQAVAALKLTADQVREVRNLSALGEMAAAPADRALLIADFGAYEAAQQQKEPTQKASQDRAAQAKLLADLDAVAARSVDPSRQQAVEHAAKINAIVTPEQWKQFHATGG